MCAHVCVCVDDKILVCAMKSRALTHLILVREVVGIKGLRREKPPVEKNQCENPKHFYPVNPPLQWEIFKVCGPTTKVLSFIWNSGQFFYANPHKARPIDWHKIPQIINSESVRCPCSRSARLMALHDLQGWGVGGARGGGGECSIYLSDRQDEVSVDRVAFWR